MMALGESTSNQTKTWPYTLTLTMVPALSISGVVTLLVFRPGDMNAALVAQILGFGVTITMATLAYLKSSETHQIVNSRMDEFKQAIQLAAEKAVTIARAEGEQKGRESADSRTDRLAGEKDAK
jgi:hypothetical protein